MSEPESICDVCSEPCTFYGDEHPEAREAMQCVCGEVVCHFCWEAGAHWTCEEVDDA